MIDFNDDYDDFYDEIANRFQDPGGVSSLHRVTSTNRRDQPCPTCKQEDAITLKDVHHGYQCDRCADDDENYDCYDGGGDEYGGY